MSLDVHLGGKRIGSLHPSGGESLPPSGRGGCGFAYLPELAEEAAGAPLLSYALPVRAEPYGPSDTCPYLEGLLPTGSRRRQIAAELGIDAGDSYELIAALGGDCPGGVTFLPEGEAPTTCDPGALAWLDEDELEELVAKGEPEHLFDSECEQRMRFLLPGEDHKLALIRDEQEDRWAWPEPGAPSTHIVKPESEDRPGMAVNEMACTLALREMGFPVVHTELGEVGGRPCLVSKRFDRWGEGAGVERLHQESLSQALGYLPQERESKGPGYAESRELLTALGEENSIQALFGVSYCRWLIGSRDEAHGSSSALLYTGSGPLLAPFYDISSASVYEDPTEPITLEELVRRNSCLVGLVQIAIECDYSLEGAVLAAIDTIGRLCKALGGVAKRAQAEDWYEPVIDEVLQRVFDCMKSLRDEMEILKPPSLGGPQGPWRPPTPGGECS